MMIRQRILLCASLVLSTTWLAPQNTMAQDSLQNRLIILGDRHYDRLEDHDLTWLQTNYPDDYRQVQEYTSWTQNNFTDFISELLVQANALKPRAMVQLGDLQEGLSGNQVLAEQMAHHVIADLRSTDFSTPWLLAKGNHDITGPGQAEAFNGIILPFVQSELGQSVNSPFFSYRSGDVQIIAIDCYDEFNIIPYLREQLQASTAKYKFIATHQPVIPVTGRLWHIFDTDSLRRDTLLNMIAQYRAVVLCGHLHDFSVVRRMTPSGSVVQIMVNSVIRDRNRTTPYRETTEYGPSLVDLEPNFDPSTAPTRRKYLTNEARYVTSFLMADMPGYAVLDINDTTGAMTVTAYGGLGQNVYKRISLAEYGLKLDTLGQGSILSEPSGSSHMAGTPVKLHAVPALGWVFAGWSGALSGTANPDSLVMDDDKEVTASFTPLPEGQCELRVTVEGSGTVQMDPPGPYYPAGMVVVLTAQPAYGNAFTGWSGAASGSGLCDTVTVSTHMSVTATFHQLMTYGVRARATIGGTVTLDPPGATQLEGTKVAVAATPAEGYEFAGWTGALQGLTNPDTILIGGAREVKARFRKTGSQVAQLVPLEDSYVRGSLYGSNNFDRDSLLRVLEGGADLYRCRSYLLFDLSSVTGSLIQANLILHSRATNNFPDGTPVNVHACRSASNTWTETTLTWKVAPAEGTVADSTKYLSKAGSLYSWDLTAYASEALAGNKLLTVLLKDKTMQDKTVDFDARETAFSPALEVETEEGPNAVAEDAGRPGEFRLEQNFPNPFNPSTVIKYTVGGTGSGLSGRDSRSGGPEGQEPGASNTRLVIYDLLGREVATLVNERKAPGSYQVKFDASGLASGVYLYQLKANQFVQTHTMVVVK